MRFLIPIAVIVIVVCAVVGLLVARPWLSNGPVSQTTTLSVQTYQFIVSPQGAVMVSQMYYFVTDHALVIEASSNSTVVIDQVLSDGRTYNMTGFKIIQSASWFVIPGWNCGYSNDNGRAETTQMLTATGTTYSLNYSCIYPPDASNVAFFGLVAPTHTPCTYVGSQPPSCTSLID